MAAVTQIRYRHSAGCAYYDKKRAEGKTGKEALRALKRQISDAIFTCLQADARRAAWSANGPGGQPGNDSDSSAAGGHPGHRLFGQATPGPATQPTTPRADSPLQPGFPARLPSRASGQAGPGPGGARPRSGAHKASLTRPPAGRQSPRRESRHASSPKLPPSGRLPGPSPRAPLDPQTKRCSLCTMIGIWARL